MSAAEKKVIIYNYSWKQYVIRLWLHGTYGYGAFQRNSSENSKVTQKLLWNSRNSSTVSKNRSNLK